MTATRESRRRRVGGLGPEFSALLIFLGAVGFALMAWAALSIGRWWAGLPVTAHPFLALLEVATGQQNWPWQSNLVAVVLCAPLGALVWAGRRLARGRRRIDAAAHTMQRPSELEVGRAVDNAAAALRLLKDAPPEVQAATGPPLGRTVLGGTWLYLPAELGVFIAAGQRSGKTVAWAIPAVLSGWGPVLATSNKPDLYRHTAGARAEQGSRVWMCDLQAVTGRIEIGFWVDLLAQVQHLPAARKIAGFFIGQEAENARQDAYFDGGARELLALYMFAAAAAGGDLTHATEWLGRDQDPTPALILRHADQPRAAARILEAQALYARQRDGLFDMARRHLNVLTHKGYAQLVTPPRRRTILASEARDGSIVIDTTDGPITHTLPQFDPRRFVESNDTLYALSMAGADSATPLTSALVGQIVEAALEVARARPDGRLKIPLLAVLDEAANTARIADLPEYYTYCGGCGILLMTIVQVLEQGENLWGAKGLSIMRAQSIEIYGGNIAELDYLEHWSRTVGQHEVADRTRGIQPGGPSRSMIWRAEAILDVAELSAMPKDRALVRIPGYGPMLLRKVPWFDNPDFAPAVKRSLAQFENHTPPATLTVTDTGSGGTGQQGRQP
ncbi:type IV secretory system conjugative DNA transfer family protein [Nocardia sp. XZ_19_385]|uniref:type IV secretory system conjugative DNA transfer family protein n=1 Tax=Nocardia sp. XZ_19_385 TaxID=2769488 RepID=UPI00188E6E85|nr:type IV secretory system conjugative DNA transfer family protein [Nocardia sp. XZ_19_385]